MTIDIVIPTYKPGEKLFESLRRLSRQTVPFGTIFLIFEMNQTYRWITSIGETFCLRMR